MNENSTVLLHFTRFTQLKELVIGDNCFMNVDQLNLIGLSKLRSVVIGENSFTAHPNSFGNNPNRFFFLRGCGSLKELMIGRYSFSDYATFEIENVPSLEVISIGDVNEASYNMYSSSLILRSMG